MASESRTLIIPGGYGFLGRILAPWLVDRGWSVVILTRRSPAPTRGVRFVRWDGQSIGDWTRELEHATAVVNLAGRSVNCRYNGRNRSEILQSRVQSTRVLGQAIAGCAAPPRVWLNSSTATIYKHSLDDPMDESTGLIGATPEAKDAFSVDVAVAWEQALEGTATPQTRKVAMRTAIVLAPERGAFVHILRRLVRLRLGGTMGRGDQYVSWIHAVDFCRAVECLIERDDLSGAVNLAAPQPVSNRELMCIVRRLCGVRFGLPATRWMLEVGAVLLRTETELIIKSRRVVPSRLLNAGFEFRFPKIETALADVLSNWA